MAVHRPKDASRVKEIGALIARLREQTQLNQRDFARHLGIPGPTLANYERGHREPSALTLLDLLAVLLPEEGTWEALLRPLAMVPASEPPAAKAHGARAAKTGKASKAPRAQKGTS